MRAAIYLRISADHQGEALGVRRQQDECEDLVDRRRYTLTRVYSDNDLSATTGVRRPEYEQMLDDMRAGHIDVIVAWSADRIYRRLADLEELITIADDRDVHFDMVRAGTVDLTTSSGRFVARILGAAATHEVEMKSERQVAQRRQAAYAGRSNPGGARPFGWQEDRRTLKPDEAELLRDAAAMIISGHSLMSVTAWMIREKPRHGVDRNFAATTLSRWLQNPRIAGIATYKGDQVGKGAWEPILDEETWRRVVAQIGQNRINGSGARSREPRKYLFSSAMVRCAACGYSLTSNSRAVGERIYACREKYMPGWPGYQLSCGGTSIQAIQIEDDVTERMMARYFTPRNVDVMSAAWSEQIDDENSAATEMAELDRRRVENGTDWADRLISREEYLATSRRITERMEIARRRLAQQNTPRISATSPEQLVDWWASAPVAVRRRLIESQIDSVRVHPFPKGTRATYLPERVEVLWR